MKTIAYIAACLLFVSCGRTDNETRLYQQLDLLHAKNDSLTKILNINRERFRKHMETHRSDNFWFDETDSSSIRQRMGMSPDEIKQDLSKHKELIQHDAVLGGTMHFDHVELLGDRYAVAFISDGHILGRLVAKYEKSSEGLKWTVLDSYIYD